VDSKKRSWSVTSRMPGGPGAEPPRRCWCMTGHRMPSVKRSLMAFMT
jgi:hypothetical protein